MKHGSLFSGIGGFDLAAEWMGWENMFHCEWNEFGQKVLKHYWPNATSYGDITKTDFTIWRGQIDILTGGFPCQPYSTAGKRKGKEDARHLWPEMLRAIREIQPRYVVGENVRGLTNWNGGMVFDEVQAELEAEGYEVLPFLLPACAVNAPHRRDRIWFVAHANDKGTSHGLGQVQETDGEISKRNNDAESCDTDCRLTSDPDKIRQLNRCEQPKPNTESEYCGSDSEINAAISQDIRLQGREQQRKKRSVQKQSRRFGTDRLWDRWENFPSQPPVCGGDDGISRSMDGITFSKWRNESIKAYGNAIVPQVAYQIFQAINQIR